MRCAMNGYKLTVGTGLSEQNKSGLAWREDVCGKSTARTRIEPPHRSEHINRFAWALRPIYPATLSTRLAVAT